MRNLGLRIKLFMYLFGILLINTVILLIMNFFSANSIIGDIGKRYNHEIIVKKQQELAKQVEKQIAYTLLLKDDPVLIEYMKDPDNRVYKDFTFRKLSTVRSIMANVDTSIISDKNRKYYGNNTYIRDIDPDEDQWFFSSLEQTEDYSFNLDYDRKNLIYNLYLNGIVREQGKGLGIVSLAFKISDIFELLTEISEGNEIIITDDTLTVLSFKDNSYIGESLFTILAEEYGPQIQNSIKNMTGTDSITQLNVSYNKSRYLLSIAAIHYGNLRWYAIVLTNVQSMVNSMFIPLIISILVSFVLFIILSLFLTNMISRPIKKSITTVNVSSNQVALGAREVNKASQKVSALASQQAASLEQTSASLEELSSITMQNMKTAVKASDKVDEAFGITEAAGDSMKKLMSAFDTITLSSQQSGDIIQVIDEIAFQTNLLALNASVEAARAGEAGKGFAVIADEVRNLALRSAEAAKNTAELIDNSINNIKEGYDVTRETDSDFGKVVEIVENLKNHIGEVTRSSKEQSIAIEQINKAVMEMNNITQSNAAYAEESAAASQKFNSQTNSLLNVTKELAKLIGRTDSDKR